MGITSVYVTHDQAEAMVISDRIVVMESGNVVQVGDPNQIYERPANRFVADFIGTMNFIPGEIVRLLPGSSTAQVRTGISENMLCQTTDTEAATPGKQIYASIRPEDVQILSNPDQTEENLFKGTIAHKAYLGNFLFFFVDINGTMVRVQVPHHLPHKEGEDVYLFLDPRKCMILF
jgi:iron(III) transport system ATP-binding protein